MRIEAGVAVALLTGTLAAATGCGHPSPAPRPAQTDLTGVWCGSSGDMVELRRDGSARLGSVSDDYLAHLVRDLRQTWTDEYIWRTYFGGRRPTSASGTWRLSAGEDPSVELDFGARRAGPGHDRDSAQEYEFGDELAVDHDGTTFNLLAHDGPTDSGWSSRFVRCGG